MCNYRLISYKIGQSDPGDATELFGTEICFFQKQYRREFCCFKKENGTGVYFSKKLKGQEKKLIYHVLFDQLFIKNIVPTEKRRSSKLRRFGVILSCNKNKTPAN